MIIETISFAKFCEIGKNIMGVTVRKGAKIDIQKIKEIISGLTEWYAGENFCILCNRRYQYSHTPEALQELEGTNNLLGLAILVPSGMSTVVDQLQKLRLNKVKVFSIQDYAVRWLEEKLISTGSVLKRIPRG